MNSKEKVLVSVCCVTYNHGDNIIKAIDSFLQQNTSFLIEIVIGEDCSTDGTRDIVLNYSKKHPDIISVITSDANVGAASNELRAINACNGKYIALCEGDDFWTDNLKLQKQVDFLEANLDYGFVHSDVNILNQETGILVKAYNKTNHIKIPNGDIFEFLMEPSHAIKNMTVCFRKDIFEKLYLNNPTIMSQNWKLIDISIWLMFAYHSKIHYIDEVMATYRLLPESMSRSKNSRKLYDFHQKIYSIRLFYAKNYGCSKDFVRKLEILKYKSTLSDAFAMNDKQLSLDAMGFLQKSNVKLNLKDWLVFYGTKYNLVKLVINKLK